VLRTVRITPRLGIPPRHPTSAPHLSDLPQQPASATCPSDPPQRPASAIYLNTLPRRLHTCAISTHNIESIFITLCLSVCLCLCLLSITYDLCLQTHMAEAYTKAYPEACPWKPTLKPALKPARSSLVVGTSEPRPTVCAMPNHNTESIFMALYSRYADAYAVCLCSYPYAHMIEVCTEACTVIPCSRNIRISPN